MTRTAPCSLERYRVPSREGVCLVRVPPVSKGFMMLEWANLAVAFRDGDILYGLDRGRGAAKAAILAYRQQVARQVVTFGFIRRTRNFERIIIQNDITNATFDALDRKSPGVRTDKQIKKTDSVKSDPQRAIDFRDFVADHPKYGLRDWQPDPTNPMDSARAAWLKTSKAGLEFQAMHRPGYLIHFILDGLAYDRVLLQDNVAGPVAQT